MSFARLAARLERRAAARLERRAAALTRQIVARRRIAARRQGGSPASPHWRSAPYLWPLFGA